MKKTLLAIGAALVVGLAGVATLTPAPDPGPIPTCNGEQATHVLVKWLGGASPNPADTAASIAPYQAWIDAGVDVQANETDLLKGTVQHDVMVALVSTNAGGFVGDPFPWSNTRQPPIDGDFMCSFDPEAEDIYYAGVRGDFIFDAGGADDYYLGGCRLDGEGSPGDRECDTMIDVGPPGALNPKHFESSADATWALFVPKGRVTRLTETEAMNHNYVGLGPGKVVVDGGGCGFLVDGQTVSCVGHVFMNGDHIHPCPRTNAVITDNKFAGITAINIEYFGPEPIEDALDPCAYQASSL